MKAAKKKKKKISILSESASEIKCFMARKARRWGFGPLEIASAEKQRSEPGGPGCSGGVCVCGRVQSEERGWSGGPLQCQPPGTTASLGLSPQMFLWLRSGLLVVKCLHALPCFSSPCASCAHAAEWFMSFSRVLC